MGEHPSHGRGPLEPGPPDARYAANDSAAERALTDRPAISIRLRIALSMAVCFFLTAGVTVAWVVTVRKVGTSQQVLERVNRYLFELEQARRYEKNFLLYGTSLEDALAQVDAAHRILQEAKEEMSGLLGAATVRGIEENLVEYENLLERLSSPGLTEEGSRTEIEHGLRTTGARAVADAEALIDRERIRMHTMIRSSGIAAFSALIIVLLVVAYISGYLGRQILTPVGRFMKYTQRIAEGDYSPIQPARRYKDEFSELALSINKMLAQIQDHQDQLTRSSRMAAVGTLTAGIAHELNNPLNNICITTEAVLEGYDEYGKEEKLRMLREILKQVERASATVRNLLDFTRVEKSVFVLVTLHELVEGCVPLLSNEAKLNDVAFDLDLPRDLPPIRGNPRDLQQVFLNLFINAIQAMPRGGTLSVRGWREEPDLLHIEVRDTGVGIPEESLGSIFDPFFTTKEHGVGTGLGLSVAYGIVEKHHGSLAVESRVGEGTTFILRFPCAAGGETPAPPAGRG